MGFLTGITSSLRSLTGARAAGLAATAAGGTGLALAAGGAEAAPGIDRTDIGQRVLALVPAGVRDAVASVGEDPALLASIEERSRTAQDLERQLAILDQQAAMDAGGTGSGDPPNVPGAGHGDGSGPVPSPGGVPVTGGGSAPPGTARPGPGPGSVPPSGPHGTSPPGSVETGGARAAPGPPGLDARIHEVRALQQQVTTELAGDVLALATTRATQLQSSLASRYVPATGLPASQLFNVTVEEARQVPRSREEAEQLGTRLGLTLVTRVADLDVIKARYDRALLEGRAGDAKRIAGDYRAAYAEVQELVHLAESLAERTEAIEAGRDDPGSGSPRPGPMLAASGSDDPGEPPGSFTIGLDVERVVDDIRDEVTDEHVELAREGIEEELASGRSRIIDERIVGGMVELYVAFFAAMHDSINRLLEQEREFRAEQAELDEQAFERREDRRRSDERVELQRYLDAIAIERARAEQARRLYGT